MKACNFELPRREPYYEDRLRKGACLSGYRYA